MKRIYMDHAATTPLEPLVREAMRPYLSELFGNPNSIHEFGRQSRRGIEYARLLVAKLIGAEGSEIIFTSSGTESDNMALWGIAYAYEKKGNHIITSSVEHHAVLETAHFMQKRGFNVTILPVDSYGMVDPEDVRRAISTRTILISIMHGNNEVGTLQPVKEIGLIAREHDVLFHTDAVQSTGVLPLNVKDMGIDLLSLSAHKIYGPKGTGALYVRKGVKIEKFIHGGEQEKRRRAGTENAAGIAGFGAACEIARTELFDRQEKLKKLRNLLISKISDTIPDCELTGHPEMRLPGIASFCIRHIDGEAMLLNLDLSGVAASSGSACTVGAIEASHVLMAMGYSKHAATGALRLSLGRTSTEEEVETAARVLSEIVHRLRKLSPVA